MPAADRQIVGVVGLELVGQVRRRARTFERRVVDIQERLEAILIEAGRVASAISQKRNSPEMQPMLESPPHFEL